MQQNNSTRPGLSSLSLAALGIVFGDIGTSPLYTLKTVLSLTGEKPDAAMILGALSLIVWTLVIVTTVKYVTLVMRVDNNGEGGILALMSLLGMKRGHRPTIIAVGLLGAALIYGDGAITPAISVLSALEGLNIATPHIAPYVTPLAAVIIVALFLIQPWGTARIGHAFGPVMLLWFLIIAALGVSGILRHPTVFAAINPIYGLRYLFSGPGGFLVLGGVFLCVTGAEALYADMGHFGAKPIRLAWSVIVFPSLILNYAGQAALVLDGDPGTGNIFYRLCPPALTIPLVIVATAATIIASQAIISGAFSMTRQAIHLGWLPRLKIVQTSEQGYGQIYVGAVNWLLMLVTLGLAVGFGKSDNLASAYGIAVSITMLLTSILLFIAMREIWGWSLIAAGSAAGALIIIDTTFVAANASKIADGGYIPLVLAFVVYGLMLIWHRGISAVRTRLLESVVPIDAFMNRVAGDKIPRVPGTAVFLTRTIRDAPPVMVWHLQHNRSLHEKVFVLTVATIERPKVDDTEKLKIELLAPNVWRAFAQYGFMERPDIPALLHTAHREGCGLDLDDVTYYVGHETIVPREDGKGLPRWLEMVFAAMQRNASHLSDYLKLPRDAVVEIGREVSI